MAGEIRFDRLGFATSCFYLHFAFTACLHTATISAYFTFPPSLSLSLYLYLSFSLYQSIHSAAHIYFALYSIDSLLLTNSCCVYTIDNPNAFFSLVFFIFFGCYCCCLLYSPYNFVSLHLLWLLFRYLYNALNILLLLFLLLLSPI